ncbi:hypothetical protein CDL12_13129 [Handroanthus impetiginosus]|uniref:Uncharacterized protein n=1 Tax=Handroanthus impetiginosus TaxID=429701 RepID=A0A2G9H9M7_9LAMI|nr:hypothetical protein CDL12_13129 [Handroanthus impetiginosus]
MKGGYGHMHATYNSSRRRWNSYTLMATMLLVFGCAILGAMGIQRLKDRRVLSLLIKEKDDQILSLDLLLQKERAHVQEVKKKTEEMKLKTYNLRAQNKQLNNRLLEMQSTISSLKEEQRTIELAFQEKQNEAKLLRERHKEIKDQNPQVKALTEILQQKEAEIEDLKNQLQVGSASTDEASVIPSNITAEAHVSGSEIVVNMHDSPNQREEQRENGMLFEGRSEITRNGKGEGLENSKEQSAANGTTHVDRRNNQVEPKDNNDNQNGGMSKTQQKNNEHETEMIENLGTEEQKPRAKDSEELATEGDAHSRKISMSVGNGQELGLPKVRLRGKFSYLRRAKGKRWRPLTNSQRSVERTGKNGNKHEEEQPRNQGKIQDSLIGLRMQNESALKNQQFRVDDKLPEDVQDNIKDYVRGYNEENSEDSPPGIMLRNRIEPVDTDAMSHANSSSMNSQISKAEMPKYSTTNSEDSRLSRKATIQHGEEEGQSKERDGITEHTEIKTVNSPGQTDDDETNEDSDNTQLQNFEETELEAITSTKPAHNSEEDKEQTDETEF